MENSNILKIPFKISSDLLDEYNINAISTKNANLDETELIIQTNLPIYKNYINPSDFSLENLPDNLMISTISATGKISCKMLLRNIDQYMRLHNDSILTVVYDGKARSLLKAPVTKKRKRSFDNQLTMEIRVYGDKKINIKIFRNGSFQMSGCKSIVDCNIVLNKLITRLKSTLAICENNKIIEIPFIEDIADKEIQVYGFKIDMINSNFGVGYHINRDSLYSILKSRNVSCRYEPLIHACVNIKLPNVDENDKTTKTPSIFVFQSGNIIITGARYQNQIISAYKYIMKILNDNYDKIVKKDIMNILDQTDLKEILEELETMNMTEVVNIEEDNIIV